MAVVNHFTSLVSSTDLNSETKKKIDPISVLVTTALIHYKEKGATLTYSHNLEVFVQEPSKYNFGVNLLGAARTLAGQGREDLAIISDAIERAAAWFKPHIKENATHKNVFILCSKGIDRLKDTYLAKQNAALAVEGLKNMQNKILEVLENGPEGETKLDPMLTKVKNLWSLTDIERINGLFEQMQEKQGDIPPTENLKCKDEVKTVEFILKTKHEQLAAIWNN